MVKTTITLSLDSEIKEELRKEKNYSNIVNDLLKEYYNSTGNLKKEELKSKKRIAEIEKKKQEEKIRKIDSELKLIEEKEKKENEILKNIPEEILADFRSFKTMTPEVLRIRFKELWSHNYKKLNWVEIKNAYNFFFNRNKKEDK